jgi:hypothetical protein
MPGRRRASSLKHGADAARKYARHIGHGTLRPLGPGYGYGGPWLSVTLLHAVKEH